MKHVLLSALFVALLFGALDVRAEYRQESIDNDYQGEIQALAEEGKNLILNSNAIALK